jgi:PPOX class probable F420-dependent enzyme
VEEIAACKRTLLITFRRDGRAVPTPVWAAVGEGLLYVRTERSAGKVKRLANDPRLLAAPCTVRGRPLGAPLEAYGRILENREGEGVAEGVLAGRYGVGRALFELAMDLMGVDMGYLEIAPAPWD